MELSMSPLLSPSSVIKAFSKGPNQGFGKVAEIAVDKSVPWVAKAVKTTFEKGIIKGLLPAMKKLPALGLGVLAVFVGVAGAAKAFCVTAGVKAAVKEGLQAAVGNIASHYGAVAGLKLGAAIGALGGPGLAVVGGVVGGVLGAMAASALLMWSKESFSRRLIVAYDVFLRKKMNCSFNQNVI
jgi:hypothetical protein